MSAENEIARLATAADVAAMVERLYGDPLTPPDAPRQVIQPAAVWRRGDGALVTLRINDATPRSAHDFFVLNLCRARADAIVTSGKILREEADLRHDLQGPARDALAAWRRGLGKPAPPISLVLTSGRGLDLAHPLFGGGTRPVINTSREGGERLAGADVEVVAVAEPSLRGAIVELGERYGARTISIEAGPSSSAALYEPPLAVDELLLSVYEESEIPERVRGGDFLGPERLEALFERPRPPYRTLAPSGRWSFARYLRR